MARTAPAVTALFTQANRAAPDRDKSADGTVASAAHHQQNPTSDHEPDAAGWVYAGDLTDDDAHGIDCRKIAAQIVARKDRRVKYLIHEGRMVSSYPARGYPAWVWRPYSGPNGHFHHLHVSVLAQYRDDVSTWWVPDFGGGKGTSAPISSGEDDEMSPDDWERLDKMLDDKIRLVLNGKQPDGKLTHVNNLTSVRADLAALDVPRKKA